MNKLLSALVLLLTTSGFALAGQTVTLEKNQARFSPTSWTLYDQIESFTISNHTDKKEYVQIAVGTGSIVIDSIDPECNKVILSTNDVTVCPLSPNNSIRLQNRTPSVNASGQVEVTNPAK